MNTHQLTDSARSLQPPPTVDIDHVQGGGVMRGAMLGGLIWLLLLGVYLAF